MNNEWQNKFMKLSLSHDVLLVLYWSQNNMRLVNLDKIDEHRPESDQKLFSWSRYPAYLYVELT